MFDFSGEEIVNGKTIALPLPQLRGTPIVHIEFFGDGNKSYEAELVAEANARKTKKGRTQAPAERDPRDENAAALVRLRQRLSDHVVRHLEAVHNAGPSKGQAATDADIPEFIRRIPPDVVYYIRMQAADHENFRRYKIEGDPEEIAEKS